jgi:DNA-binding NtrC family response regulator
LLQLVQAGTFREDLYYRLAVIPLHLPPLRERVEDIPLLAGHLLARHAVRLRRGVNGFTQRALAGLLAYSWPGNIRELDNRIQRGVALTPAGDIDAPTLFGDLQGGSASGRSAVDEPRSRLIRGETVELEKLVVAYERDLVEAALKHADDNLTEAARLLGINFRQIRYKVKQLGLR